MTGGDKVDSGIGLSYWPARLHRLADCYDKPYAEMEFLDKRLESFTLCYSQSLLLADFKENHTLLLTENPRKK
jgi:hypothetical protein